MMLEALKINETDFKLSCVEPYEMPWLRTLPVQLFREKVEKIPVSIFQELQEGDILFIDSSHIIRPEGDVLYELFEILPRLKPGVYIHIHDIFTPHHYPERWLREEFRLWNEQYLVEAFLINNSGFEIIGALNYLSTKYNDRLFSKLPIASHAGKPNGSSLWLRKMIK